MLILWSSHLVTLHGVHCRGDLCHNQQTEDVDDLTNSDFVCKQQTIKSLLSVKLIENKIVKMLFCINHGSESTERPAMVCFTTLDELGFARGCKFEDDVSIVYLAPNLCLKLDDGDFESSSDL